MNRTARVSELKARLSGYLAEVRNGGTITVCNRETPIARIVPIDGGVQGVSIREAVDPTALPVGQRIGLKRRIDVVPLLRSDRAEL
ncbi:MAG: type II toxin-antitoxin system prevent-host-death family antitoxin [Bryobacterales bacterium]|nr:type II toxin-antitoxin system prevent-host-death family antitoxin [Bryobacterales bacterium]